MSKIWTPQPKEVYQGWIDTLLTESTEKLTPWEVDFIDSIQRTLNHGNNLSERQAEILEKIYVEKTN